MNRAAAALMGILFSTALAGQSKPTNYALTLKSTTDSAGHSKSTVERFVMSGSKARIEITTLPSDPFKLGTSMIFGGADSTLTTLIASTKTAIISRVPRMDRDGLVRQTIADASRRDSVDLGPGERILGYPTHHYRVHGTATLTTTFPDRVCTRKVSSSRDIWVATDPAARAIVSSAARSPIARMGTTLVSSWMDRVDSMMKTPRRGIALRIISADSVPGAGGQSQGKTTTVEYTELSEGPVDPSEFTVPAGYRVRDIRSATMPDAAATNADLARRLAGRMTGCVPRTSPPGR